MTIKRGRFGLALFALIALVGALVLAAGCSGDEKITSTTASSSATTAASNTATTAKSTTESTRYIVGGNTKEEYEASLPDLVKAVEAAPNDLDALQKLAIAQYNTGRLEDAAATYQKMLQIEDTGFTRNNYGNVLRDMKKYDEAKAQYEKAVQIDPTQVNAWANLATVLASQGDAAGAIAVIDRGIAAVTGDAKARLEAYKAELTATTTTK
jgi:Tfp pilus assembly protein PilF